MKLTASAESAPRPHVRAGRACRIAPGPVDDHLVLAHHAPSRPGLVLPSQLPRGRRGACCGSTTSCPGCARRTTAASTARSCCTVGRHHGDRRGPRPTAARSPSTTPVFVASPGVTRRPRVRPQSPGWARECRPCVRHHGPARTPSGWPRALTVQCRCTGLRRTTSVRTPSWTRVRARVEHRARIPPIGGTGQPVPGFYGNDHRRPGECDEARAWCRLAAIAVVLIGLLAGCSSGSSPGSGGSQHVTGSVTHAEATRRIHALAQQSLQGLPSGSRLTSMVLTVPCPARTATARPPRRR